MRLGSVRIEYTTKDDALSFRVFSEKTGIEMTPYVETIKLSLNPDGSVKAYETIMEYERLQDYIKDHFVDTI